jgi:hypothetical protein
MSRSNVRKTVSDKLLHRLSAEENRKTRKAVQGTRPQLLYLENINFINEAIQEMNNRHGDKLGQLKILQGNQSANLKKARELADIRQKRYINKYKFSGPAVIENTPAGKAIFATKAMGGDPRAKKLIKEGKAFIVSSFGVLRKLKVDIIAEIVSGTEDQIAKLKSTIDRGHGPEGSAVSSLTIQRGLKQLDTVVDDESAMLQITNDLKAYVNNSIKSGDIDASIGSEIKSIVVDYHSNITKKGAISAAYIPSIVYQNKYENRAIDAIRERQALDVVRKFFEDVGSETLAKLESSSSLEDRMYARVIESFIANPKNKQIKLNKKIDSRKIKFKAEGKVKQQNKSKKKSKGSIIPHKVSKSVPANRKTRATQGAANLANILGILNARLPSKVVANMNPPALENRTGRFAASVRATDIIPTKQGYPSIGYTYQKNPYQVFESSSGSRFSSPQRDPRVLIDKSIREILAEYLIGRIYTRRE